jgi:hypothetical protein
MIDYSTEPWTVDEVKYGPEVFRRRDGSVVGTTVIRKDADRILACVNACKGIPTEELSRVVQKGKALSPYPWAREVRS